MILQTDSTSLKYLITEYENCSINISDHHKQAQSGSSRDQEQGRDIQVYEWTQSRMLQ
jgi:hypothetical protein